MHGSTTTSSAKLLTSRQSAQIHEIAKSRARLTQARVLHNYKQRHGWIENYKINKTPLLIILKRHGSLGNNMNIWPYEIDSPKTRWKCYVPENSISKCLTLQARASHHTNHKNTWVAPLKRWQNPYKTYVEHKGISCTQ